MNTDFLSMRILSVQIARSVPLGTLPRPFPSSSRVNHLEVYNTRLYHCWTTSGVQPVSLDSKDRSGPTMLEPLLVLLGFQTTNNSVILYGMH